MRMLSSSWLVLMLMVEMKMFSNDILAAEIPNKEDGWFVPKRDGSSEWMTAEEFDKASKDSIHPFAEIDIKYYLFTHNNPSTPTLIKEDGDSLSHSNFDKKNPTRFIIHGWENDIDSPVNYLIRQALLNTGDYNVFCVDWGSAAKTINYITARNKVPDVGKQVARFIDFLFLVGGMSFDTLHVIGHSLGAHVSGFAGKNVKSGKIDQITGLDPAMPLFYYDSWDTHLAPTDAVYVESIHTCGNYLGFLKPIGRAAFYPNGGKAQPGCGWDLSGACAHGRAYEYYAESIEFNDFICQKCGSYSDATHKLCGGVYEKEIRMGAPNNFDIAVGTFFVPLNENSPYGKGHHVDFTFASILPNSIELKGKCSQSVEELILMELYAAKEYFNMGAYFSMSTVNLQNLAEFFFNTGSKVYKDLSEVVVYFSKGEDFHRAMSDLQRKSYHHSEKREWKDAISALEDALKIETLITRKIKDLLTVCLDDGNYKTNRFLNQQLENEKNISTHIKSLKQMVARNPAFGEFIFDKEL